MITISYSCCKDADIEKRAVVRNSIIFNDSIIRSNSIIDKTITDKKVEIKANCRIGCGDNYTPNQEKPDLLDSSLNIIAKRAAIPEGTIMDRNCRVYYYVEEEHFQNKNISSGSTITSVVGKNITTGDEDEIEELNK